MNRLFSACPALLRHGCRLAALATLLLQPFRAIAAADGTAGNAKQFGLLDVWDRYGDQINLVLAIASCILLMLIWHLYQAQKRLQSTMHEHDLLLNSIGEGVYGVDREGRCRFINPAALKMLGFAESEVVGRDVHLLFHHHDQAGQPYLHQHCPVFRTLDDGRERECEEWFFRRDGQSFPARLIVTPMREKQQIVGAVVSFQDITESKQADADLRIAAVAFEAQEGMVITDCNNCIIRVNKAFSEVTGYTAAEAIGQTPAILRSGRHDANYYHTMWNDLRTVGRWHGEIWNRRKNGEVYPEWLTITAVRNAAGEICHYVAAFLDISHRKAAESQIEHLAFYDPLTHLPNRSLLYERLGHVLAAAGRHPAYSALLFIDLDNFKTLNDSLGHDMGDLLLIQIAERLQASTRAADTVARLGGDEFIIMLEALGQDEEEAAAQAEVVGEKIIAAINEPFRLREHEYHTTPSIGIALFHDNGQGMEELLRRADLAMYQAKAAGRNTLRFFDPQMQSVIEERVALETEMRRALKQGEFVLHYQPQVNADGHVTGAEALVRWQHPERGMVPPGEFITLAESTGLIVPLGLSVLEMACQQLAQWQQQPETAHLTLAVNVSVRQFRQADFVEQVHRALQGSGANPARLKLELTESLLVENVEEVISRMEALRQLGLRFSLDDFGTGYSSLSYLKRLPLDQLKIDQSFVRDVLSDPNDAAIARTVLALGHSLGLSVIAEGVENEAQRDFLMQHGCTAFQGYLFGRPGPTDNGGRLRLPAVAQTEKTEKTEKA